jgi:hypothetical protein
MKLTKAALESGLLAALTAGLSAACAHEEKDSLAAGSQSRQTSLLANPYERLAADYQERLGALMADYSARSRAIRQSASEPWRRKRQLIKELKRGMKKEKNRLDREYRNRLRGLREERPHERDNPYQRGEIRALEAQLADHQRALKEDFAFRRKARLRALEGRALTPDDLAEELRELDKQYQLEELKLRDDFWSRRAEMLRSRGRPES